MAKTPLKAFLLAAGLGTRLKPLTDQTPKCLLPIGGKPLLQIWLEHLAQHGVGEVLINTHCHHRQVETFLAIWPSSRLQVLIYHEPRLLGSAGTLLANRNWVNGGDPFFIIYGDNLSNVNLKNMLSFHHEHGLPFTLGVFRSKNPKQCGIVEVTEDDLVTAFVEKPENPKSDLAAAGIYVTDRRLFDFFPEMGPNWQNSAYQPLDLGYHVIPRLVGQMKIFRINDFLMDIGTLDRYKQAQVSWTGIGEVS
jgi:mannose-1-phosphate guanylyltransferase